MSWDQSAEGLELRIAAREDWESIPGHIRWPELTDEEREAKFQEYLNNRYYGTDGK